MTAVNTKSLRFYQGSHLNLWKTVDQCQTILRNEHKPLALIENLTSIPLATDAQNSIHNTANLDYAPGYSPYGYRPATRVDFPLAYTGAWWEPPINGYLLGNGYRAYSATLMRFQSPDSFSPFGAGGLNRYGYCKGDPINNSDPSGHMFKPVIPIEIKQPGGKYGAMGTTIKRPATAPLSSRQNAAANTIQHRMDSPGYTPEMARVDIRKIKLKAQLSVALEQNDHEKANKLTKQFLKVSTSEEAQTTKNTYLPASQTSAPASPSPSAEPSSSVDTNTKIRGS